MTMNEMHKQSELFQLLFFTNCGSRLIHFLIRGVSRCGGPAGGVGDASRKCYIMAVKYTEQEPTHCFEHATISAAGRGVISAV